MDLQMDLQKCSICLENVANGRAYCSDMCTDKYMCNNCNKLIPHNAAFPHVYSNTHMYTFWRCSNKCAIKHMITKRYADVQDKPFVCMQHNIHQGILIINNCPLIKNLCELIAEYTSILSLIEIRN